MPHLMNEFTAACRTMEPLVEDHGLGEVTPTVLVGV